MPREFNANCPHGNIFEDPSSVLNGSFLIRERKPHIHPSLARSRKAMHSLEKRHHSSAYLSSPLWKSIQRNTQHALGAPVHRWLPHSVETKNEMLEKCHFTSDAELFRSIPASLRDSADREINLPAGKSELETLSHFTNLASQNVSPGNGVASFLGGGIYRHYIPSAVSHLVSRSEFLTAYTPYQPEVSQGTLQCIFEFQTQIARLTGMDAANASMYDGPTAAAEAMLMAARLNKKKYKKKVIISGGVHPQYSEVMQTFAKYGDSCELVFLPPDLEGNEEGSNKLLDTIDDDTLAVFVQNPSSMGHVTDLTPISDKAHSHNAHMVAIVTEPLSMGMIKSPGSMGVDTVVGEGQSLAGPPAFGGPGVGFMATMDKNVRLMPGRLVGVTLDSCGKRSFVLTLGTREQHIRREKATSNICSNSGLMALAMSIHMTMLGERGMRSLARLNHERATHLLGLIKQYVPELEIVNKTCFNEFLIKFPSGVVASDVVSAMLAKDVLGGIPLLRLFHSAQDDERKKLEGYMLVAVTERNSDEDMEKWVKAMRSALDK